MSEPRPRARTTLLALAGALAVHLQLALYGSWYWQLHRPTRDPDLAAAAAAAPATPSPIPADGPLLAIQLVDGQGRPVVPIAGAEDRAPTGVGHPLPSADLDSPGERAAARAGGGTGGNEAVSDQHYRRASSEQPWSDPRLTRQARVRNAATAASEEAILRDPARGIDDRTSADRPQARDGDWARMDPRFHAGSGAPPAQPHAGAVDPRTAHV
ncbi:MAG TPA: hypothetical protein VFF36_06490, partial [Planctomycetota bacterium]|nr:hypothetical protein [Planctomycetota bacterium]